MRTTLGRGMIRFYLPAGLAVLGACALPPKQGRGGAFVSDKELTTAFLVNEGIAEFKGGRYETALEYLLQAQYLEPDAAPIKRNLAVAFGEAGEHDKALALYDELLAASPDSSDLRFERARVLLGKGHREEAFEEAVEAFRAAQDEDEAPLATVIAGFLTELAFRIGREDDAICYSALSLPALLTDADIVRHAKFLIATGRYRQAAVFIEGQRARSVVEQDPTLSHVLALAEFGRNNLDEFFRLEELAAAGVEEGSVLGEEIRLIREQIGASGEGDEERSADDLETPPGTWQLFWPGRLAALFTL